MEMNVHIKLFFHRRNHVLASFFLFINKMLKYAKTQYIGILLKENIIKDAKALQSKNFRNKE